ncbi:hypothetical protein EVAR_57723_1 [Eumeta japonica]|uniref:Uncharacterized protein n=1 Tax=Eumeta variegata TaxID=151549 RepID=A0A4C1Y9P6_EUMVA|nr:hypothetical protein EVAR_57723_1 [Eumeta japonica]
MEPDVEEAITTEDLEEELTCPWKDAVTDGGLFIKKEHDFAVKMEHENAEVTVKHELEIEPTVLQSNTAASLHPSTPIAQVPRNFLTH